MVEPEPSCDTNDEPPLAGRRSAPREITSTEILRGAREVLIRHGDETYRLRLTRNGKLILHK